MFHRFQVDRHAIIKVVAITTLAAGFNLAAAAPQAFAASSSTSCLPGNVRNTLSQIEKRFGRIQVVSTHRPGARIAGNGNTSYHASCRAADFAAPKGKHGAVVSWLKSNFSGGVGTYSCGMHHIHIDNGPHVRWHKCV
jgi:uncharacterized protein YcbK (DUF882 family)